MLDWQILTFYHSLLPCGDPGKGNYKHKSEQSLLPAHLFNALIGLFIYISGRQEIQGALTVN